MIFETTDINSETELKTLQINGHPQRRAFFAVGLEGSGTNMMAEALVASGCKYVYEIEDIKPEDNLVVIRRSWPHAGKFPNLHQVAIMLASQNFEVNMLLIVRDSYATYKSISNRREAEPLYLNAQHMFSDDRFYFSVPMADLFEVITYESFTTSEGFRKWLFEERLQLPFPVDYEVRNENLKYYD